MSSSAKSSLFNALAGASAIVSDIPGTTRDYLSAQLRVQDLLLELIDTPGLCEEVEGVDEAAQFLGRKQHDEADLLLVCVEAGREPGPSELRLLNRSSALAVATKSDCCDVSAGWLATSALTLQGLAELRAEMLAAARRREEPALASSSGRCRGHVAAALSHLRAGHSLALDEGPAELVALEIRLALEELGHLAGMVYTDDLLDRVFSRFCIGK
ncbi:MAG: hypothetical protein EBV06_01925 [Planctomycetia bacterium]|nr:hypothetical protein [Planctomycetia bacterium]